MPFPFTMLQWRFLYFRMDNSLFLSHSLHLPLSPSLSHTHTQTHTHTHTHTHAHTHTHTKPRWQTHAHLLAVMLILMVINDITTACGCMVVCGVVRLCVWGGCVCLLSKPWEQGALQGGESGPPTIHMLLLFTQTPSLPRRIIRLPSSPVPLVPSFFFHDFPSIHCICRSVECEVAAPSLSVCLISINLEGAEGLCEDMSPGRFTRHVQSLLTLKSVKQPFLFTAADE